MPLTTVQAGMLDTTAQYYSFKNRIINGAMVIAQRATSAALQFNSSNYTALDRYVGFMAGGSQSGTFSRVAITDLSGFNYCAKLQRTAAGTNTANIQMGQAIETLNCADLAGQTVTLSFYLKAGANFSASGSNAFVQFASGTGTDQSFSNMTGTLWTGQVNIVNFAAQQITTSWVRYSYTATLGATVSQLGFEVGWTPTGTAGADDALYITGVQLEKGGTATSFDYRPYGTELALCQRYYEKSYDQTTVPGSAVVPGICLFPINSVNCMATFPFAVEKRATPSISVWDAAGTANAITTFNSSATQANGAAQGAPVQTVGTRNVVLRNSNTVSGAITGGYQWTASAEL